MLKSLIPLLAAAAATVAATTSCNNLSEIGGSITQDSAAIVIDTGFTVTGQSVENPVVLSRTVTHMLGRVDAPGYGTISSRVVTQFMPALELDTAGVGINDIDSLHLIMQMPLDAYIGDPLAPTGITVYRLNQQLSAPIYTNHDPAGTYDPTPLGSTIFNATYLGENDSLTALDYKTITVRLPRRLGQELYAAYINNPLTYAQPENFARIFPGIYIDNTFGSGRISRMAQTTMRMYYTRHLTTDDGRDSTVHKIGNYYAVTPEIVSDNIIDLKMSDDLRQRVAQGQTLIVAPTGLDARLTLPVRDIINSYKASVTNLGVINSLSVTVAVEDIPNKYNIGAPPSLLLILKKDKDKFFLDNQLADNLTSWTADYDPKTHTYTFTGLRDYLLQTMKKETVTDDDETFMLIPVNILTETSMDSYGQVFTHVTAVNPYVTEPVMTRVLTDKTKIKFVYTKQSINF